LMLVEILVVIALIALVSGGVALAVFKYAEDAKRKTAETETRIIRQAVRNWRELEGRSDCPSVDDLMAAEVLEGARGVDPWGRPYRVRCEENRVSVGSMGPDGHEGTKDDVPAPKDGRS